MTTTWRRDVNTGQIDALWLAAIYEEKTQFLNDAVIFFLSGKEENFNKHSQRHKGP